MSRSTLHLRYNTWSRDLTHPRRGGLDSWWDFLSDGLDWIQVIIISLLDPSVKQRKSSGVTSQYKLCIIQFLIIIWMWNRKVNTLYVTYSLSVTETHHKKVLISGVLNMRPKRDMLKYIQYGPYCITEVESLMWFGLTHFLNFDRNLPFGQFLSPWYEHLIPFASVRLHRSSSFASFFRFFLVLSNRTVVRMLGL